MGYDPEKVQRISFVVMIVGFTIAIVSAIGELLGWWNDLGEIGMAGGTFLGGLAGVITLLTGATSEQAGTIAAGVGLANVKLDRIEGKLTKLGKLDKLDELDRLYKLEKLDDLDVIQVNLDEQTGVLDRQVTLLTEIRDRL